MTSGMYLTVEQVDRIRKFAAMTNPDGSWVFNYHEIAEKTGVHHTTVSNIVREGNKLYYVSHHWK